MSDHAKDLIAELRRIDALPPLERANHLLIKMIESTQEDVKRGEQGAHTTVGQLEDIQDALGQIVAQGQPMTLERAREILATRNVIGGREGVLMDHGNGNVVFLRGCDPYVRGDWTADELEALAVWMRAHGGK